MSAKSITLLPGFGVEGDAHAGKTVMHRSRVRVDPAQPNLRQVHLIHLELLDELIAKGFRVRPGAMGENITTSGLDLLSLSRGARLAIGDEAILEVTGLRSPCGQLNGYQEGLMAAVLGRDESGKLVQKAGIMAIVLRGGVVKAGDTIELVLPREPRQSLEPV